MHLIILILPAWWQQCHPLTLVIIYIEIITKKNMGQMKTSQGTIWGHFHKKQNNSPPCVFPLCVLCFIICEIIHILILTLFMWAEWKQHWHYEMDEYYFYRNELFLKNGNVTTYGVEHSSCWIEHLYNHGTLGKRAQIRLCDFGFENEITERI